MKSKAWGVILSEDCSELTGFNSIQIVCAFRMDFKMIGNAALVRGRHNETKGAEFNHERGCW